MTEEVRRVDDLHLRFGPHPIKAPYLVGSAGFVGCHRFGLLARQARRARLSPPGRVLLLNASMPKDGASARGH